MDVKPLELQSGGIFKIVREGDFVWEEKCI